VDVRLERLVDDLLVEVRSHHPFGMVRRIQRGAGPELLRALQSVSGQLTPCCIPFWLTPHRRGVTRSSGDRASSIHFEAGTALEEELFLLKTLCVKASFQIVSGIRPLIVSNRTPWSLTLVADDLGFDHNGLRNLIANRRSQPT